MKASLVVKRRQRLLLIAIGLMAILLLSGCSANQEVMVPDLSSVSALSTQGDGQDASLAIQLLLGLTVLSLAPAILMLMTSFTRIVIVLSFVRNAVGMPQVPPNQVLIGLALFLTLFSMEPTLNEMNKTALQPYASGQITQTEALQAAQVPLRNFMLKQAREKDIALFVYLSKSERPRTPNDLSLTVLIPAFVISELRTAFQMGVVIFLPFIVIDMVVSSTLMSMGMMMLPPSVVSLPFKLLLFVMVDGWHIVVRSLLASFS